MEVTFRGESSTGEDTETTDYAGETDIDEEDNSELEGRLQRSIEHELNLLNQPSAYKVLSMQRTGKEWKKAESSCSFGYTGNLDRSRRQKDQKAREKETNDAEL